MVKIVYSRGIPFIDIDGQRFEQSAFWWFDFFGGYYNSPEYERELTFENEIFRRLSKGSRESASEAANSFVEKLQ